MLNRSKSIVGTLAATFMLAGCLQAEENAEYCYDQTGQAVLSGRLGAACEGSGANVRCQDRGLYIAYYQPTGGDQTKLAGYEVSGNNLHTNNQRVRKLCDQIARGQAVALPLPRQP